MQRRPERKFEQTARPNVYRCPACGETVNNSDLAAVRRHHQHVLQPRLDAYVSFLPTVFTNKSSASKVANRKSGVSRSRSFADPSLGELSQSQDVNI
jgi:hypothetical protein